MLWQRRKYLVFLGMAVLSLSCTRLPERLTTLRTPGGLPVETLLDSLSIPAAWGNLVGVTQGASPLITRLWFQDAEGTVRMVMYNNQKSQLVTDAAVIRRTVEGAKNDR